MQHSERAIGSRLTTKDDLDGGLDAQLAAFRAWYYRALFVQALCIVGLLTAVLVYPR